MTQVIAGRANEIEVLERFLDDDLPEPRSLLIQGAPGIGKTSLLRALLEMSGRREYSVAMCQPTRSEMDLSYAGLVGMLDALGLAAVDALPAPQAQVLRTILRLDDSAQPVDRLSLGLATVAAMRAEACDRPLVIAVDDSQWLDQPTARILAFLVRRLGGTRARVVVVRSLGALPLHLGGDRSGAGDDPVTWSEELARAMPEGRFERLEVGPVDPSDLSQIMRRALGWAPAWPRVVRIAELSQGNPLHALELARAFGASWSGDGPESPMPDSVLELARSRIEGLPDQVRDAVGLASVPRNAGLDLLGHLDPAALDLRDALETAARQGILTIDAGQVRFTHPILGAAAYASLPQARRRELHRTLAMLSDNLEERARHLAAATDQPDPQVAVALEGAAEQAWRRGAPDTAADLLHMACRLTPAEDVEALARRRIAYGRLLHSAGDAPGAVAELDAVVASLPSGLLRATALFHLMYVARLAGSLERAVEHGTQAADEAVDDPLFQAEVLELLSRISDNDIPRKLDAARRATEAVDRAPHPDPEVLFQVRAALVEAEFYAGLGIHLEQLDGLDRDEHAAVSAGAHGVPRRRPGRTSAHLRRPDRRGPDDPPRDVRPGKRGEPIDPAGDPRLDGGRTGHGRALHGGARPDRGGAGPDRGDRWDGRLSLGSRVPRRRAGQARRAGRRRVDGAPGGGAPWRRSSRGDGQSARPARPGHRRAGPAGRRRRGGPAPHPRRDQAAGRGPRATIVCPRGRSHRGARRGGRAGRGSGGDPPARRRGRVLGQPVVLGCCGTR